MSGQRNLVLLLACAWPASAWLPAPLSRDRHGGRRRRCPCAVTPRAVRDANHFTFHAIVEVAVLFAGIFLTMVPALDVLHARGRDLGLVQPWQFFWATGLLSSFLDNAPTYLTFARPSRSRSDCLREGRRE